MTDHDWTMATGLRNAALSLLWRAALTLVLWLGALWVFHAALGGIGVARVPVLIAVGFAGVSGTVAGLVISRGLDERAGFVGPVLTLLTLGAAALVLIGGDAIFDRLFAAASVNLRYLIVGASLGVAAIWIFKNTWLDA